MQASMPALRWWVTQLLVTAAVFFAGHYAGQRSEQQARGGVPSIADHTSNRKILQAWSHDHIIAGTRRGYYLPQQASVFYKLAIQEGTDKVTGHSYEDAYTKYFEVMPKRDTIQRLFEIGLGCTMTYGPGASTKLWRRYLPQAEIWQAEFNADCVKSAQAKLDAQNVKVVTGDQSDTTVLKRWIQQTGGDFDVIVDDGGHMNMQQFNSFLVLFEHALRPGGVYIIEDLQVSRAWVDGDKQHIMIDVIKEWIEGLVMTPLDNNNYKPRFGLPPGIKSVDCFAGCCVFTKCFVHDHRCVSPATNTSLLEYSSTGTGILSAGK